MVKLNSEGLTIPVSFEELKNLPLIPGSAIDKRRSSLTPVEDLDDETINRS